MIEAASGGFHNLRSIVFTFTSASAISEEEVKKFIFHEYQKEVLEMKRLDAYEDINIRLKILHQYSDSQLGYKYLILKIFAAANISFLDLQHRMMSYLFKNGILTCVPVPSVGGKLTTCIQVYVEDSKPKDLPAVVLTYVEGVTLRETGVPDSLLVTAGRYAGQLDKLLMGFEPDGSTYVDTLWELSRVPDLERPMHEFCEKQVQSIGMDIIKAYKTVVMPNMKSFRKGFIHGDLNDVNIIIKSADDPCLASAMIGIIDFGDVCVSAYVYELGTLMADLISSLEQRNPFTVGRLIVKGYREKFELNKEELSCLRIVICVRLLQYYVLSAESLAQNPENRYAGLDREHYLRTLDNLWNTSEEDFRRKML